MRIAVISDVHGNAFALEAVLQDLRRQSPDIIVNLGDQIEGMANPRRAAEVQAGLGAVEVRGNNEEKLWPGGRRAAISQEIGKWLEPQIDPAYLQHLAQLPLTQTLLGKRILLCHGTPDNAWHSLLWVWNQDDKGEYYRARHGNELRELVEPLGAELVICGHTHRAGMTRAGDTLVVNVGSVSDQADGDPRARWALLDQVRGNWLVDFRAVDYDVDTAVAWAKAHSPFGDFFERMARSGRLDSRSTGT